MPALDMSLEELKCYKGCNPRPVDFDDFWQRGIDEVRRIDPGVELVKADFQVPRAECYHLYFTGTAGARIHAQLLRPKKQEIPGPGLIRFHGYTGNSGDWSGKLAYVAQGFTVAAMDCRGQGGLSEDKGGVRGNTLQGHIIRGIDEGPEKMLFRQVFLDTYQLSRILQNMDGVDPGRIGTIGASQGGALAVVCGALNPEIKRIVSIYPFLSDYKRVWEMDLTESAYWDIRQYFRRFDPLHTREDWFFKRLDYIDVKNMASRIKGKLLMAVGLADNICPPSTQFAVYNNAVTGKDMLLYPDFGHEDLPGMSDAAFRFLMDL